MDGIHVVQFAKLKAVFLFTNGKCLWCSWELSPLRGLFWVPKTTVKIDGFEGFLNIMHTDRCDI